MNDDTLKALQGSIAKWEAIVAGTEADKGYLNCALCKRFGDSCARDDGGGEKCPVMIETGMDSCTGSPYDAWADAFSWSDHDDRSTKGLKATTPELIALAQAELDFLKSLLP